MRAASRSARRATSIGCSSIPVSCAPRPASTRGKSFPTVPATRPSEFLGDGEQQDRGDQDAGADPGDQRDEAVAGAHTGQGTTAITHARIVSVASGLR